MSLFRYSDSLKRSINHELESIFEEVAEYLKDNVLPEELYGDKYMEDWAKEYGYILPED